MSYRRHLREIANKNHPKAIEEARKQRGLESQQRQAKLEKLREQEHREYQRIESRKAEIKRKIEDAAERGYYELAVAGTKLQFDFLQWYNPFNILTGRLYLLSSMSASDREVMEAARLCRSLGFKPFLRLVRQHESGGGKRCGTVLLIVKW